ncbi:MAG: DUF4070 domain-containing protein [Anaerolineaceae bacterium]|nr:DUF4070 domain-containing protein [Anaerolineaceae bacterium]
MNILMIYPEFPDTFWSFKHALRFVSRRASSQPLGLITVASMLPEEWNKRLVDVNVQVLTDEDLSWANIVFLGGMIVQRDSAKSIAARCKQAGLKIVAGGPLFTMEHQNFPEIDHFVLNEAEITLAPFLADLEKGTPRRIYQTDEFPDITQTPIPTWDLVDRKHYDAMSIQFSRGCPYSCDFCNITSLLGHRPRTKTAAQIVAELNALYATGWRRNVFFVDDNFIGNKRILKEEVLPALIAWRKGKKGCNFSTEASINLSDDPELMHLMVAAGFNSVFVGIETPDDGSLTECHKNQNKNRDLIESVKRLQREGLQVMGGFIVGFDNDTPSIFQRQIDFIQNSGIVTAMVGLLQAPPGTQLYNRMEKEGRLVNEMSGDNVDGTSNIVPKMDAGVLYRGYKGLMDQIYSPDLFYERVRNFLREYTPVGAKVKIEPVEILAFFRSIYRLGIRGIERVHYWKLFFWTLFNYPNKFPLAITFSIYRFHFAKVNELHLKQSAERATG